MNAYSQEEVSRIMLESIYHTYESEIELLHEGMIEAKHGCFFHPTVKFGKNVKIGAGVIIEKNCSFGDNCIIANYVCVRPNTTFGNNCKIGHHCVFEGDSKIGNVVTVQSLSEVCRFTVIEDKVFIGPHFTTADDNVVPHDERRNNPNVMKDFNQKGQHIKYGARIGTQVACLPHVVIGKNSFVAMGSLVTKDVPDGAFVRGRPAQWVKDVPVEEYL